MKYYVEILNLYPHLWQIELLIESFKVRNLDDDLIISINSSKNIPDEYINLKNHKNLFEVSDKLEFIVEQYDDLEQNFSYLHSDMVLLFPVGGYHKGITFKESPVTQKVFWENREWYELGNAMIFQEVPKKYFIDVREKRKEIGLKAAWVYSAYKNRINLNKNSKLETHLGQMNGAMCNFIHYKFGYPPHFHKAFFYAPGTGLIEAHPYDAILRLPSTKTVQYIKNLIYSYRNRKNKAR